MVVPFGDNFFFFSLFLSISGLGLISLSLFHLRSKSHFSLFLSVLDLGLWCFLCYLVSISDLGLWSFWCYLILLVLDCGYDL